MKKIFLQLAALMLIVLSAAAQAPQSFNYQGVARNTSGSPLAAQLIGLRISVHDGSSSGTVVYQETFAPTTNAYGLYNVGIGTGTVASGTFAGINWSTGNKYIGVEIDPAGGTSYTSVGTSELLSVPYALFAANGSTVTASGTANQVSKFTGASSLGNSLIMDNGSGVSIDTTPVSMGILHVGRVGAYGTLPYYQAGIVADGGGSLVDASGIYGEGGWRGVYGHNPGTAAGVQAIGVYGKCEGSSYTGGGYGVLGEALGNGATNYGVYGNASGGTSNNYGVYGTNSGTGYAGYFTGNVHITGSIAKGSGTFMIDHPLDPENKYLYHSFVESPDMMNVYNGNITTDANGNATVTLPEYFEALNKDFRYQLTTIGQPSQVYVSQEISGNTFQVKSDKPNVKVSWQVTGVRQDKYANAHRVVPEVEKEAKYKGFYLHAAEWGQPQSKSIDELNNPKPAPGKTANEGTN